MISQTELNEYQEFHIETTCKECFKIRKLESGYQLIDTTPPILEKTLTDYKSVKLPKNANMETLTLDKVLHFDGINKGFQFAFYEGKRMAISKGKIERLFIKQQMGSYTFNVHLFEPSGRKIDITSLFSKSLSLHTETNKLELIASGVTEWSFEGRKVHALFSLFNTKKGATMNPFILSEYDASPHFIYYNRAMVIITEDQTQDTKYRFSFINEPITEIKIMS